MTWNDGEHAPGSQFGRRLGPIETVVGVSNIRAFATFEL